MGRCNCKQLGCTHGGSRDTERRGRYHVQGIGWEESSGRGSVGSYEWEMGTTVRSSTSWLATMYNYASLSKACASAVYDQANHGKGWR